MVHSNILRKFPCIWYNFNKILPNVEVEAMDLQLI